MTPSSYFLEIGPMEKAYSNFTFKNYRANASDTEWMKYRKSESLIKKTKTKPCIIIVCSCRVEQWCYVSRHKKTGDISLILSWNLLWPDIASGGSKEQKTCR